MTKYICKVPWKGGDLTFTVDKRNRIVETNVRHWQNKTFKSLQAYLKENYLRLEKVN